MSSRFKISGLDPDWVRFFGLIAIFAGLHFGDNRYVTKAEYSADQAERKEAFNGIKETFAGVREAIISMDKSIALLETTRRVQDDHETRIRALEKTAKLSYEIEKNPIGSVGPALLGSFYNSSDR